MANPIVNTLPEYVEQNAIGLIGNSVLGARTLGVVTLQTGVKTTAAINLLNTDVKFGDGSECGFDPAGSQELSQRNIVTGQIKVNMNYCDKALLKTFAQHEVKIAAGAKTLPFEQEFTDGLVNGIQEALDKALWMGDTASEDENLNKFDGFVKIIGAAEGVVKATGSASKVYEAIKAGLAKLPARALKADTKVYLGTDAYLAFIQEMVAANLYHYSADNDGLSFVIPGTKVEVLAIDGLAGSKKMYIARASNMYAGVDMEGDAEKFELWYSQDNREFRFASEFNAGVQVAFPDEIVEVTLS